MTKVSVSVKARQDLVLIRRYIREELSNPQAARRILGTLKKSIQSLAEFSRRGRHLDTLISVHTEYQYLVCENYCIFYISDENEVIVVRVLHQRQDCLRALLMENDGSSTNNI